MNRYHTLLQRQLRRLRGNSPPPEDWLELLTAVNEAYEQFDRDRTLLERSMEISSQELLQANADIRAVLEGMIDYYLRIDESGKILHGRGSRVPLLFMPDKVATGTNLEDATHPEIRTALLDAFRKTVEEGTLHISEYSISSSDRIFVYEVRCLRAQHRQVSIIIRDITEARNAAAREQRLQQRLLKAERIESLGLLAGTVAHDLNNILSPLVSYPDLLIGDFAATDPKRKMVEQMQRSAIKASAIIQDLLTLTRRGNHHTDLINLNVIVRQYLDSPEFAALAANHPRVKLKTEFEDTMPALIGSAHQIEQVIMNLVVNAFEAISGDGLVTIRTALIDEPSTQDTPDSDIKGAHIRFDITDTGIGIPEYEIDHIFEPFFSRRKSGRSGTGLGLAIVYGTIKDFKGTIQVESRPGQGTHFLIRLPIPAQQATSLDQIPSPAATTRSPCHILVIDDDPVQQELSRHLLLASGYTVDTVSNGRAGVAYLRQQDADIVLLDMIMKEDFDGLRTYESIRTFKPDQKVIIVSGFAKTDNVQQALKLGVCSFVQKPYTMKILLTAIQSALNHRLPK